MANTHIQRHRDIKAICSEVTYAFGRVKSHMHDKIMVIDKSSCISKLAE